MRRSSNLCGSMRRYWGCSGQSLLCSGGVSLRRSLLAFLASLPDTQGNFLIIFSYSYTTVTSVSVLVQSSFLSAAVLSYVLAKKRYTLWEYAGLGGCLLGMVTIVVLDLRRQHWMWTGDSIGDVMALCGAMLFSLTSVLQEHLVHSGLSESSYLAHISLSGLCIITLETWLLESSQILRIHTTPQLLSIALFAVSYTGLYAGMPFYLREYGATLFNMSLIPNIVYTLVFAAVAYREHLDWMYVGGLGVVLAGLVAYNASEIRRNIVRTPPLLSPRSSTHSLTPSIQ